MKKKRVFFLLILSFSVFFLLSLDTHVSNQDLRDYVNFSKTYKDKSIVEYKKYLKTFSDQFPKSILIEEIQKLEPYFLFKETHAIKWKGLPLSKKMQAMNLILEHYKEFNPKDIESSFNEILSFVGREPLFRETFSNYIRNVSLDELNEKMKKLTTDQPKLARLYGWYFFQTSYYSFSDAIFKSTLKNNKEDSLYYLGASYFQKGNYAAARSYIGEYIKNYPAFNKNPESKSYHAYDLYFKTLVAMEKYDEAFLKLKNFNRKRFNLVFYYKEYLLAKKLGLPIKNYENRLVSGFPKSSIANSIKRRNLIQKIKSDRDFNSFKKFKKIFPDRRSYADMMRAVVFEKEQMPKALKNTDDLFYYYVLSEKKYNPFPEVKEEMDEWLKEAKADISKQKKTSSSLNKVAVFYGGSEKIKKDLLGKQNLFFKKYFESDKKLGRDYEGRIDAFLSEGLGDVILKEIEKIYKKDDVLLFLAKRYLFKEQKNYYAMLGLIRQYLRGSDDEMLATDEILEDLYPKPYYSFISRISIKYGIPVDFVYSIMRTESAFKDTARSHVGAEGLMQVMPFLSKKIYNENAEIRRKYKKYDPYNVYMNLEIGVYHLSKLYREFDHNLLQVAVAYNAGSSRAKDWTKDSNNWLEYSLFIPFNETQNYVYKVFRSLEIYKNLYH